MKNPNQTEPIKQVLNPAENPAQEQASDLTPAQTPQVPTQPVKTPSKARKTGAHEEGADLAITGAKQVRKQGQRGKDKQVRKKRTDSNQLRFDPDDRVRIFSHNMALMKLGKMKDRNDIEEVRERISFYFESCMQHKVLPTVAGFACALGIDRTTLWTWLDNRTGVIKNPEVLDTLKSVFQQINMQYEDLLTQGKIVPVAGFFLMQNNFGYKNQTDHVVVAQQTEEPNTEDIAARAGLLEDDND